MRAVLRCLQVGGKVPGAVSMPSISGVLQADWATVPTDLPFVVYCAGGGRSAAATAFLVSPGLAPVYDMQGGFNAYKAGGFPTRQAGGYSKWPSSSASSGSEGAKAVSTDQMKPTAAPKDTGVSSSPKAMLPSTTSSTLSATSRL